MVILSGAPRERKQEEEKGQRGMRLERSSVVAGLIFNPRKKENITAQKETSRPAGVPG